MSQQIPFWCFCQNLPGLYTIPCGFLQPKAAPLCKSNQHIAKRQGNTQSDLDPAPVNAVHTKLWASLGSLTISPCHHSHRGKKGPNCPALCSMVDSVFSLQQQPQRCAATQHKQVKSTHLVRICSRHRTRVTSSDRHYLIWQIALHLMYHLSSYIKTQSQNKLRATCSNLTKCYYVPGPDPAQIGIAR